MPTAPIAPRPPSDPSRVLLLFLTVALLVFVLLGFFTLYLCRYMYIRPRRNDSSLSAASGDAAPPPPQGLDDAVGLDPSVVASFPTFTYSWVKNLQAGKYGLDCAVCLSEFHDDDVLRLLTACSHVFHTDCIDVWLKSHTTCPYCRHELNPAAEKKASLEVRIQVGETGDAREVFGEMRGGGEEGEQQRRSSVSFKEEEEEEEEEGGGAEERRSGGDLKRMVRSNSTGHSSMGGGREDRFTLRLPKDVKERIARVRNWTGSCIDFEDFIRDVKDDDADIGRSTFADACHGRM